MNEAFFLWSTFSLAPERHLTGDVKFGSLPEHIGGGQYSTSVEQPGKLIESQRAGNYWDRILIRMGLSPDYYEIDHIVPLWAGGTDNEQNKEILDKDLHQVVAVILDLPLKTL